MHEKIAAHSACHQALIMLVYAFHKNSLHGSFIPGAHLSRNPLYLFKQTVEPVFYHILRNLIFHHCRGRARAPGIDECKRAVIAHLPHNIQRLLEIFFRLSRKTDDNVCCQGNIRHSGSDLPHQFQIAFLCIPAVHLLQDSGASGLYRKMEMGADLL